MDYKSVEEKGFLKDEFRNVDELNFDKWCDYMRNYPSKRVMCNFEMVHKWYDDGLIKVGNRIDGLLYGKGSLVVKECKIVKVRRKGVGDNLREVIDVLKRLDGGFFDSWEFKESNDNNVMVEFNIHQKGMRDKVSCDIEVGGDFTLYNEDIGRVILSEDLDDDRNRIKIEVMEMWGKRKLNDEIKGGVGRSILTILNIVCKGLDILIELCVGDVRRRKNFVEYDFEKLKGIYESRGFTHNPIRSKGGMYLMDSRVVLEEYAKRMIESGEWVEE